MNELPKSVREQLAKQVVAGTHPDADVLTAFSEDALMPKERQQVMEHLAACSECREVVFLAQPEAATQTVLAPVKSRRFAWMAWASAAAVVVVVGSAVLIQREQVQKVEPPAAANVSKAPETDLKKPQQSEQIAKGQTQDRVAAPTRSVAVTPQETLMGKDRHDELAKVVPGGEAADKLKPDTSAESKQTTEKVAAQPIITAQKELPHSLAARDSANVAQSVQQNAVQGVVAGGPANTANANLTNVYQATNQAAPAAPPAKTARSKAESAQKPVASTQAFGYALDRQANAVITTRPHWRISELGTLERSLGGDVWSPVLVKTQGKFHVVSVVGDVVWAGGENGALYVSRDGGNSWFPVKLGTKEAIISIHFSDGLHGTVQGDSGTVWKTSDGGATWAK